MWCGGARGEALVASTLGLGVLIAGYHLCHKLRKSRDQRRDAVVVLTPGDSGGLFQRATANRNRDGANIEGGGGLISSQIYTPGLEFDDPRWTSLGVVDMLGGGNPGPITVQTIPDLEDKESGTGMRREYRRSGRRLGNVQTNPIRVQRV